MAQEHLASLGFAVGGVLFLVWMIANLLSNRRTGLLISLTAATFAAGVIPLGVSALLLIERDLLLMSSLSPRSPE